MIVIRVKVSPPCVSLPRQILWVSGSNVGYQDISSLFFFNSALLIH